jgi:hypothetical protein
MGVIQSTRHLSLLEPEARKKFLLLEAIFIAASSELTERVQGKAH